MNAAASASFRPLRPLRRGDTVAVVAPAGPARPEQLALVEPLFARFGLQARLYPSCRARHPVHDYLAGDDALRLADLHAALADPAMQAVFCLRGGYGCTRLLEGIDTALVRAQGHKPLVGYSDITALHALWQREGVLSVHAPMPASDLVRDGAHGDAQALFALLMQAPAAGPGSTREPASELAHGVAYGLAPEPEREPERGPAPESAPELLPGAWRLPGAEGGRVSGRLLGGNLSLVAALAGTPWQIDTRGAILFLEDVSEAVYRVDRLLVQLRQAGALRAARGFLLGSFTEDDDPTPVLREHLGGLGKPVLFGWPAGHGRPNRPLVLGARVTLDVAAGSLRHDEAVWAKSA